MTSNDVNNYNYLCQEMNALLGKTSGCKTAQLELNNFEGEMISVAPNPCNKVVYIDFKQPLDETVKIELIDVLGHCVRSQLVNAKDIISMDVLGLSSGLYSVVLHSSKQIFNTNLLVE